MRTVFEPGAPKNVKLDNVKPNIKIFNVHDSETVKEYNSRLAARPSTRNIIKCTDLFYRTLCL